MTQPPIFFRFVWIQLLCKQKTNYVHNTNCEKKQSGQKELDILNGKVEKQCSHRDQFEKNVRLGETCGTPENWVKTCPDSVPLTHMKKG